MDIENYMISGAENVPSPSLIYYSDIIEENTKKVIKMAGGAERLWPHVKTHKMADIVKRQIMLGITRFKCATIAEAEMAALCGAEDILIAYPLVGPNIRRFIELNEAYPASRFWALGDNFEQLSILSRASEERGLKTRLLIDVNIGMNRTGTEIKDAETLYIKCAELKGLEPLGLHCFSGNYKQSDVKERQENVDGPVKAVFEVRSALINGGCRFEAIIFGSTPSLPCYAKYDDVFLSPGTAFVTDWGYYSLFKDLDFEPGAAILSRVVSRTRAGLFTLDLGYKAIAADPQGARGVILGFESAEPLFHCEEHWTFKMRDGEEDKTPEVGSVLYVIPTHICPTTALYPFALSVKDKRVFEKWEVTARNRQLNI